GRDGGLLSYGPDRVDIFRRAASYVDRILRGEKPGDLPVQFPTKFEMVVNRKTATALGLAIPPSILLRAAEVIESFDDGSSSRSSAARRLGRPRRGRNRATACGASACSWEATKMILKRSVATLRSVKRLRAWVGPMAARRGPTFVGAVVTSIAHER